MINSDDIKKINNARLKLSECKRREEVEEVFAEYGITDYPAKIALLRRCMQIQETNDPPDIAANDKTVYEDCLDFFLTGDLKESGLTKGPLIPDSEGVKKNPKKSKASFDTEELCKSFNVSEAECVFFKNFFNDIIVPRIKKKYLARLISVVEDIIEGAIEKNRERENSAGRYRINMAGRYKIKLIEGLSGFYGRGNKTAYTMCFSRFSIICYNPNFDVKTICASIAHELGHLLQHYGVIHGTVKTEDYANLFAFFAIKNENDMSAMETPSYVYHNETEIIEAIKAISSGIQQN